MDEMRRLFFFLLFVFGILAGHSLTRVQVYRDVFNYVCKLSEARFYKPDQKFQDWLKGCESAAARLPLFITRARVVKAIQTTLSEFPVSHFQIYTPSEDRQLWHGETFETGLRSHFVEDLLIVYRVMKGSPAEKVGVRAGDVILQVPEVEFASPYGAQFRAGEFTFRRAHTEFKKTLSVGQVVVDQRPKVTLLSPTTGLLEIESFRADFFQKQTWLKTVAEFSNLNHVIVDLRNNRGGNIVAMMRALSTFFCGKGIVGQIDQPRKLQSEFSQNKKNKVKMGFDDDTDDDHQIEELDNYSRIKLKVYNQYGCYKDKVTVLIGPETASVAEIFAHAFLSRTDSRVWGQPTAGDVILAVWYELKALGEDFSVSIPEAIFVTNDQSELEGHGVRPQKELYHELSTALKGQDGWILKAL